MTFHDGHIHTPFCPHGTKDALHKYCDAAIGHKLTGITFAEHAPLPDTFDDPTPLKDSAMSIVDLESYIREIKALKREYQGHLNILLGLEVDYIEGFEKETTAFLNEFGPILDDAILSVHFLKMDSTYVCIDYSPDVFEQTSDALGSVDAVYDHYYQTVGKSILAELGSYKPKRIGHLTLARKFKKKFPATKSFSKQLSALLANIKKKGYELDYNGAGSVKPLCKEPYPFDSVIEEAIELAIPLVYGSDAHQVTHLMSGYQDLLPHATLTKPQAIKKSNEA